MPPDVDSLRWIIEQQYFRIRIQPPCKDDFLLVAAAQAGDKLCAAVRFDIEHALISFKFSGFIFLGDDLISVI